jgi:hypothetical protein
MHSRMMLRTLAAAAFAALASTAGAQVQATFYANYPSTPDPLGPYLGGSVLCSASTFGTAAGGFSLNFNDAATRMALCPANPDLLSPYLNNQLGARFTGALVVASTGTYNITLNADDGDALAINGAVVRTDWYAKAGGPGQFTVDLNAGSNPFVFDYFQGPCCNAFAELIPGDGVIVSPPVPEPASVALIAAGLAVVGLGARRRRQRAAG